MLDLPELFAPAKTVSGRISMEHSFPIDLYPVTAIRVMVIGLLFAFLLFESLLICLGWMHQRVQLAQGVAEMVCAVKFAEDFRHVAVL